MYSSDVQVKLVVRRDDFALGQENPWHEIFTTFGEMIRQHTGDDNYKMLRGDFTTTHVHQSAAYDVAYAAILYPIFCFIPHLRIFADSLV
jgi:hypothetical protein